MKAVGKRATFMTNAPEIAKKLRRMCHGEHEHLRLEGGGRTKQAEVYPDELCKEIVRGLKRQMEKDGRMMRGGFGCVCAVDDQLEKPRILG